MQLPDNSEIFKSIVIEKIKTYCDTNIWPFEYELFAAWLGNFDCEIEEYVALQMLDNLVVRSNDMAKASYARLLHGPVRQFLKKHSPINTGSIQNWKTCLVNGSFKSQLRLSPVRLKTDEGESGSVIYRMLSNELDTNQYSLAIAGFQPEVIILIDDFIGGGRQFKEYAIEFELEKKLENSLIIYCPLIAFEQGVAEIKNKYPKLHILPAEHIYKSDGLFYGDLAACFKNDQQNTLADVKEFLRVMHRKYAPGMPNCFGYQDAGLPLAFEWGCPNQSPSLLYLQYSRSKNNWQQLFSRRS